MTHNGSKQEPKQKTQPRGIDPKTGQPYDPVEIPVPKRESFEHILKKALRQPKPPK